MLRSTPRSVAALLSIAALTAVLTAQGAPIGFEETFALSADRQKAVATLIPGTDDFYYYHCLERLGARDFATVRQVVPVWIERHGRTARVFEIENREALLSAGDDPGRAFAHVRDRLGLGFNHERVVPGAVSTLPTALDPELLSPVRLTERALHNHPSTVDGFHDTALPGLAATNLDEVRLHSLLARLDRPDVANLPALIVRDLSRRNGPNFGDHRVHLLLRRSQLEECARLRPELLRNKRFVDVYLQRLQPSADVDWRRDPAARSAQFARLWQFAQRLSPAFNSLRAHVLYHWLAHDLAQGTPDRARFLDYLRLPRQHFHPTEQLLRSVRDNSHLVDLALQPPTSLPPVAHDEPLLRSYFEHFFATDDNYEQFAEFVDADWLKRVFAETKLLLGQGDPQTWYTMLGNPALVDAIEKRVELNFAPTSRTDFAADEAVELTVHTKNVGTLLVKVFAIDTFRCLVERQQEVDAQLDLDGVVANHEQTARYDDAPVRRIARTFALPMLKDPGTYVVEFVGNGISSRAVIHKGHLRSVERTSSGGHLIRVHDELGALRKDASVWFGGREYFADERGDVLLPFSTDPGQRKLVLRAGARASLTTIQHRAESYSLHGNLHVAREALRAGGRAKLTLRAELRLDDHGVDVSLLEDRLLVIVATDLNGVSTTQEIRDPLLVDAREFVHEITVPERLAMLTVTLRGKVKDLAGKDVMLSTLAQSFVCNRIDETAETAAVMPSRHQNGFCLDVRGKNGEVLAGHVCYLHLELHDYRDTLDLGLQTDARGRIELGTLPGVRAVTVTRGGSGFAGRFVIDATGQLMPTALHGLVGTTLRVPYLGTATAPTRDEVSLLGSEEDAFSQLAIADGFLELRDLAPGDYELRLHRSGHRIPVRITQGAATGGWLVGRDRVLSASDVAPLHLHQPTIDGNGLTIRLANATPTTRVHVVVTRFLPTFDPLLFLSGPSGAAPVVEYSDHPLSSYHAGRKLSEEYRYVLDRRHATKYPGNMLGRPSLLANPWRLDDSRNDPVGIGGGEGEPYGGRGGAGKRSGGATRPGAAGGRVHEHPGQFANLDWLPQGAVVLTNLTPDADGVVQVPAAQLGDGHVLTVVAIDRGQALQRSVVREEQPLAPRQRHLPQALDSERHFIEQKRIEFVAKGGTVRLDDARQAQVEIHDSLRSVFGLFASISRNAELAQFGFLLQWPKLDLAQRRALYDQFACHELHFFLFHKDPQFFADVVKPLLTDKHDKTFLDHWLLGHDLTRFREPWTFAQLNLIERVLLAKRLGGAQQEAIVRSLREGLELRPVDRERFGALLDLALRANELADVDDFFVGSAVSAARKPGEVPPAADPMPELAAVAQTAAPAAPPPRGLEEAEKKDKAANARDEDALGALDDRADSKERRAELRARGQLQQLYRAVAATKLVVEHNWWHRRMEQSTPDVVAPNRFWIDYAAAPANQPFASASLIEASTSVLEMLMALSVLDLPFEAGEHQVTADGNARTLTAAAPLLLVRKEVQPAEAAADQQPLLIGQNLFRIDDRYRFENGERRDAFVSDEFVVGVAYGCQVVVTNPTSQPRTAEVLLQIPAGALPLQKGFWTKGVTVALGAYATTTIEYAFYFPAAGDFAHYPAHAAEKGKLAAHAAPRSLHVVVTPTNIDTKSWEHVSQQGSPQEVLAYLDANNLQRLDLAKIAWRMKDRDFFTLVIDKLRARHVFDQTLWSYSILHRDAVACREFLRHQDAFLAQCGLALDSPLCGFEPKERRLYQHLELDPLVHPRAHQLGGKRVLGNHDLAQQYGVLMRLLGYHDQLSSNDWLVVAYYLLLQDRIEEGLSAFAKVDPAQIEAKVQYDYLAAYTCFFTGDVAKARSIAERHREYPVEHWQKRFANVLAQLDEAAGGAAKPSGESQIDAAANAPALEVAVSGKTIDVGYKNLGGCEVRYYELDVEFAFSAQPFANAGSGTAAFVQPALRDSVELPKDQARVAFELPERFHQKNVLIEVRAGGLVRNVKYFTNALSVRFLETFGQVAVNTETGAPLAKAYVKVFARLPDGKVRFHKDGYTDLRGRFDYASLSDDPNLGADRYAVLVLDEQRGAIIREVAPPSR